MHNTHHHLALLSMRVFSGFLCCRCIPSAKIEVENVWYRHVTMKYDCTTFLRLASLVIRPTGAAASIIAPRRSAMKWAMEEGLLYSQKKLSSHPLLYLRWALKWCVYVKMLSTVIFPRENNSALNPTLFLKTFSSFRNFLGGPLEWVVVVVVSVSAR